ncbi:MAG: hypothetical protein ACPGYV_07030 [Phycisphaeraceae bacterium]
MKRRPSEIRNPKSDIKRLRRERGAAAVLSMMFLVIFGSLGAAMAIVSQGNLHTADTHLKVNRSLAASETGLRLMMYRLSEATQTVLTRSGAVWDPSTGDYITTLKSSDLAGDPSGMPVDVLLGKADAIWDEVAATLAASFAGELHNQQEPYIDIDGVLHVGPIAIGPNAPAFTATFTPHPIVGEDYDSDYYARPPYSEMAVSASNPLDARFIRVSVEAYDGIPGSRVHRSVSMDFQLVKRIEYAVLSRSRVMIGRNVMIEGRVGSTFAETDLINGHPMQIASDFRGLDPTLDSQLDALLGSIIEDDQDGDNRLSIYDSTEVSDYANPEAFDTDGDGYITEFDFFLSHFDTSSSPGQITTTELEASLSPLDAEQLMRLIDTFGSPLRAGYNDGVIDEYDRYAKVRGEIHVAADLAGWEAGAANATGEYQDYLQGPIVPTHNNNPLTFESSETGEYELNADQFDVSSFRDLATDDFLAQAAANAANHDPGDPDSPQPLGSFETEAVPFQATYPYDYYDRPVYENMTFRNVKIPKGTNALFKNCRFIGVTFIETELDNDDPDFNYAGMQDASGDQKHPDRYVTIDGTDVYDTKTIANNIRFHNCTFEGGVVTDVPDEYTHARNKVTFTGNSGFDIENSTQLTQAEKMLYRRSSLLAPQYSIEMGTFVSPYDSAEVIQLSGTIVAGLIDMRGQVNIDGQLLTTFEPQSNTGPVIGDTSPQFNTTLGYFSAADGDLETEAPENGLGVIHVRYNKDLPLPDGILGPVEAVPLWGTYFEGGKKD